MMLFQLQSLCGIEGGNGIVSDQCASIWKEMLISCLIVPSHHLLEILSKAIKISRQVSIQFAAIQTGSYKILWSNYQ
jgi:hypothetical protein